MYGKDEDRDSDYEDDTEIFSSNFKPSYVIIAVDTHPLMFIKNANGVLPFRMCLEACYNVADSLLFRKDARSWRPFAVVVAGVSTPLITFDKNVLESIKLLKTKSRLSDGDLIKEFQRNGNLDLSSFLFSCKKLFHDVKSVFYQRNIIYLTNDDKPISDKNAKFTALNEVKTFNASQINFQIVPTITSFNYRLFYNELFSLLGGIKSEEICTDTEGLTQKLLSTITFNINKHNIHFYPFKGDSFRYLKCSRLHIFSHVQLYNTFMTKDGKKVVNTADQPDSDTLFTIKYINYGKGENVQFDAFEKDSLHDYQTPKGLTLLYVADRQIGIGHIVTRPSLLGVDPKEELPYFGKFWDNCVASNKVLVCILKVRQPDKIKYVELIPVLVDGNQMFLEKRLPFGNEIALPMRLEYNEEEIDEDRKQAVQQLVDQLTFEFDPKMLPDILFQKKKAYIKAKLLDEPLEPVNDVQVDHETVDSVLEKIVTNIKDKFKLTEIEKKRRRPSSAGNRAKKTKKFRN